MSEVAQAVKQKDAQRPKSPILERKPQKSPPEIRSKLSSLFDDAPLFTDDIFSTNNKFSSNLFADDIKSGSLFDDEKPKIDDLPKSKRPTSLFRTDEIKTVPMKKPITSLFSPDSPDDDIFGSNILITEKEPKEIVSKSPEKDAIKNYMNTETPSDVTARVNNTTVIEDIEEKSKESRHLNTTNKATSICAPKESNSPFTSVDTGKYSLDYPKIPIFVPNDSKPLAVLPPESNEFNNCDETIITDEYNLKSENPPFVPSDIETNTVPTSEKQCDESNESYSIEKNNILSSDTTHDTISAAEHSRSIFSSEPPPLEKTVQRLPNLESDLFNTAPQVSTKSGTSTVDDFENDLFGMDNEPVSRKLSDGRLDLFSDSFDTNSGVSKGGLFDWGPPELEKPPPLKESKER